MINKSVRLGFRTWIALCHDDLLPKSDENTSRAAHPIFSKKQKISIANEFIPIRVRFVSARK
jgi:hypothetical protein